MVDAGGTEAGGCGLRHSAGVSASDSSCARALFCALVWGDTRLQ